VVQLAIYIVIWISGSKPVLMFCCHLTMALHAALGLQTQCAANLHPQPELKSV